MSLFSKKCIQNYNFNLYNKMDGGSDSDDDNIAQQAALAAAKFGNIQKKNPMMN